MHLPRSLGREGIPGQINLIPVSLLVDLEGLGAIVMQTIIKQVMAPWAAAPRAEIKVHATSGPRLLPSLSLSLHRAEKNI